MINLLPTQQKTDIIAARANIILIRYIGIIILAFVFILAIFTTSETVLSGTLETAKSRIEANTIKADVYTSTQQEVNNLSSKLSDAKMQLDSDISYSTILTEIGKLTPSGVVIKDMTLNDSALKGSPLAITAYAQSTAEVSTLQRQFQSSPLFTQVSLQQTNTSGGIDSYPVSVSLSVTFNKNGIGAK